MSGTLNMQEAVRYLLILPLVMQAAGLLFLLPEDGFFLIF